MKIYTKTGDTGTTALYGGKRVSKDDIRVEAYGSVDELNAFLGLTISKISDANILLQLNIIQNELFVIGSHLATDPSKPKLKLPELNQNSISSLEKSIDRMDAVIPELKYFVLPGGSHLIASIHICRTVCRRAERRVVSLSKLQVIDEIIIVYLNRLSDYLFVLARYVGYLTNVEEIPWKP
ncbi:MAG: cob(I)yrinic acid a,c-diamide adenosyltransferase [Saprospiraceae bacterium]